MTNAKSTKRALLTSVMALILCFTMLLGTTFAWFTDSVTSEGNIIKSGKLEVEMYWADGGKAVPAVDAAGWNNADTSVNTETGKIFTYQNWEPGYVEARHILIKNVGTLALNYELRITTSEIVSELANVIDVYYFADATQLNRATAETGTHLGTLADILGTNLNISNTVNGMLREMGATDDNSVDLSVETFTLALKMQESAGNEYKNLSFNNFNVELIATQAAYENDSFGPDYDKDSLTPNVPAAKVVKINADETIKITLDDNSEKTIVGEDLAISATLGIGGSAETMNLNTMYKFQPTQTAEEMEKSEYKYYTADFLVSADRPVAKESIALAGYYTAWCQFNDYNWVAMINPEDVGAGEELRLVEGLGAVHYKDICQYGNDGLGFICGAVDLTGENAGTTITVKLCLFETDADPNGSSASTTEIGSEPIVIGVFEYTFDATPANNQAELDAVLGGTDTDVALNLGAGNYTLPNTNGKTVEIVGTKDTVIDVTGGYYADQANLTFKGVTFDCILDSGNGGDYELIYSKDATFIDCTFNGAHGVGRDGAKYIGCTFNLPVDYVWSFANDVVFDGCTFNSQGKALLLYNHGGSEMVNVTVTNCVFNSTAPAYAGAISNQPCAAIEIDNYGCSFNLTTSGNTIDSDFSGEWRIKSFYDNGNTVTVNGTAYTKTALDGTILNVVGGQVQ